MNSRWYLLPLSAVVIATSYAAFGVSGIFVALLVIILAILLQRAKTVLQALLIAFIFLILGIVLFLPSTPPCREAARRMQCVNNLKQLGLALHNYKMATGSFLPLYSPANDGKPMHSWRVLVLPYLEQEDIYKKYNFAESWDSPNNRKLLSPKFPFYNLFQCPTQKADASESTAVNYVAVVGKNTAWRSDKSVTLNSLTPEEASKTILVIETADSGIQWNEPRDFCVDDIPKKDINTLTRIRGHICVTTAISTFQHRWARMPFSLTVPYDSCPQACLRPTNWKDSSPSAAMTKTFIATTPSPKTFKSIGTTALL